MTGRSIYLSTCAFQSLQVDEILAIAGDQGYLCLEWSSRTAYHPKNLEWVRNAPKDFQFLAHNYFPPPEQPFALNLASPDEDALEMSRRHCLEAIKLTAELGAPFYAAHAGFLIQPRADQLGRKFSSGPTVSRDIGLDVFRESVDQILRFAESLSVGFYIENNVASPFNVDGDGQHPLLLAEPVEIDTFMSEFSSDHFGLLMDVAHLKVSGHTLGFEPSAALEQAIPHVKAFHLSDNDGRADTNDPFGDTAWFLPFLAKRLSADIVIEAKDLTVAEIEMCFSSIAASSEAVLSD